MPSDPRRGSRVGPECEPSRQKTFLGVSKSHKDCISAFFSSFFGGFFSRISQKNTSLIYAVQEMFQARANRNPLKL